MNATTLYIGTCRLIFQAKVDEPSFLFNLCDLFPRLRQSLSCSLCGNLLKEPHTLSESTCQHHVCKNCKGGRKKLKHSCNWCKDYRGLYVENVQLRILIQCYKKLCLYVTSSDIYRTLTTLPSSSNNNNSSDKHQDLISLIKEGADFKDDYKTGNDQFLEKLRVSKAYTSSSTQTAESEQNSEAKGKTPALQNGVSPVYSVYAASGNRLTLKRTDPDDTPGLNGESSDGSNCRTTRLNKVRKRASIVPGIVTKCQCQMATARSSCRGYRCPCYSADRPCMDCACRSCNNPLGFNKITENAGGSAETSAEPNNANS